MVKDVNVQKKGWFKESLKLAGWSFLILFSFVLFYQALPALLVVLGHMSLLLGTSDVGPSVIDAMIFILTGFSFTCIATYLFYKIIKIQWGHVRRIRTDLAQRLADKVTNIKKK